MYTLWPKTGECTIMVTDVVKR